MNLKLVLWNRPKKDGRCPIVFDLSEGRGFRKRIPTDLSVKLNEWDASNQRVNTKNPNNHILNVRLSEYRERLNTGLAKFETKQFNRQQLIGYLEGRSDFSSVDAYIDTEIKNTRKSATYQDYKGALTIIKKYSGYHDKPIPFDAVNYALLDKFKRNAKKNGVNGNSINSYFNKIRAVMNDAYDKNFIYEKFHLNKKLRVPTPKRSIQTCTPEDFRNAIEKVRNIYDWQALSFYLLMFCTRGMYLADIVNFKMSNFENSQGKGDFHEDFNTLFNREFDYMIHRRNKTRDKGNEDMKIRIDLFPTYELICLLKQSVLYTHYHKKPEIIPPLDEKLTIFSYDIDKDYSLHSNVWDIYKKKVKRLLGYSFKTARKTFNTYALQLKVSDSIRRILLGHQDSSMLQYYDNLNTIEILEQVDEAHTDVLKAFYAEELGELLFKKLDALDVPKWVSGQEVIYSKEDLLDEVKKTALR